MTAMANMKPVRSIEDYRADFPALKPGVAFLDSAASAQKPQAVIDAMAAVMENHYANIHRGLYAYSQKTTELYEHVRSKVAGLINAPSDQEIVFTRSTTESVNLVAQSWAKQNLREGDEIILSEMEHHANIVPWLMLADEIGIRIKVIPLRDDGALDLDAYERLLSPHTKMVSVVYISNALGTRNDVKKITAIAKDFYPDMKVMVDGSQAVVHQAVDVQDLGCDFFVFTGHKLYGPTGAGVLWGRAEVLESMKPYQGGGDMVETVDFDHVTFKAPPARFEAGTPAIVEVIGLGAAIDYVTEIGLDEIAAYEADLSQQMHEGLRSIDGLKIYGETDDKIGIASFTADWGHASDIGMILDQCGVAVRTGHHCCQPVMKRFGIDATVRASLGLYSHKDDIEALIAGLDKAKGLLS